jgi:hypothetical protein
MVFFNFKFLTETNKLAINLIKEPTVSKENSLLFKKNLDKSLTIISSSDG